jgi:enediyne polyketide synthase
MGCDIEKVEFRDKEEWQSILEYKHSELVNQMLNTGIENDINNCYTRLWGVRETCMKAHAFIPTNISIESCNQDAIIFKTIHDKNSIFIMSFHFDVLPKNKYIISFTARPKESEIIQFNEKPSKIEDIFDPLSRKFTTQFLTTFKDCRGFHGKTYFTDFPLWMGNLREYILAPVKKQLLKDLGSGEFGMVTNDSTINIYNEADTLDKITGRLWITEKSDLKNSLIDLAYEWYKHTEDGKMEKISDCILSTTWVKIEKRGIVKISPIPQYFYDFLDSHLRKSSADMENIQFKNKFPQQKDLGTIIYEHKNAPRPEILLNIESYHTGIYNSNTVGNLYYSNYYDWQAKNIESFFYQTYPDLFLKNGKVGEYICLKSNTIHLQEAMPFEEIEVHMYLDKLYTCGMRLYFEFYSRSKDEKRKLAYGHNSLLWAKRPNEFSLPEAEILPESISERCLSDSYKINLLK